MREEAIALLARIERGGAFADIVLDRALRRAPFRDSRDRALLTALVMGTLRRQGSLDFALAPRLARPLDKADPLVRAALRLGAYQIYHTRIPGRAAVHETVEALKKARGEKPAGFANAVLRRLAAAGRTPPLPEGPGREAEAARLSAPLALVEALAAALGEEEARAFLAEALEVPPFSVRVNPFRAAREAVAGRLAAAGADPVPCRFAPDGLILREPGGVHDDPGWRAGEYLVMDEGAQLIAPLLAPRPGEAVLDACAAPGGKTTHLAALAAGKARVVATDVSEARLGILRETVARTGTPGIDARRHDFAAGPLPEGAGRFDKVLVDAPCTGVGVIRRNPDAKWRFRPGAPARLAALQTAILRHAFASVRPGGLLAYCTCSPLPPENEAVVARFLGETPEAAPAPVGPEWPGPRDAVGRDGFVRLLPHRHGTDGFFAALLRRGD